VCDARLQYNTNHVVSKSHEGEGELAFTSQWRPAVKFKQEKTHTHKINCTSTILQKKKKLKLNQIIYIIYKTIRVCAYNSSLRFRRVNDIRFIYYGLQFLTKYRKFSNENYIKLLEKFPKCKIFMRLKLLL